MLFAGLTPLSHAIDAQHLDSVKLLVKMGANMNAQDHKGRTCLMTAAYEVQCVTVCDSEHLLVLPGAVSPSTGTGSVFMINTCTCHWYRAGTRALCFYCATAQRRCWPTGKAATRCIWPRTARTPGESKAIRSSTSAAAVLLTQPVSVHAVHVSCRCCLLLSVECWSCCCKEYRAMTSTQPTAR